MSTYPDAKGRYGMFGGRYVPETLVPALDRLQAGVDRYLPDPQFQAEFAQGVCDFGVVMVRQQHLLAAR